MDLFRFGVWFRDVGIVTKGVTVRSTLYAGRGIYATETLHEGNAIGYIPQEAFLQVTNLLRRNDSHFKEALAEIYARRSTEEDFETWANESECEVVCLFLIYCKSGLGGSEWKDYVDVLPTVEFFKGNHVLFNVECVEGTSLEGSTRAKLAKLERQWKEWQEVEGSWLADVELEFVLWADCVFWSRAVDIGSGREGDGDGEGGQVESEGQSVGGARKMALVPFFDIANHSLDGFNIRWQLYKGGLELVVCNQKVVTDQELFLNYGEKSNQELLFLHGFCIENNPEPSVVTLPVLPFLNPEADPINIPKILWLKSREVPLVLKLKKTDNLKIGELIHAGWSHQSILMMYLVVLEEEHIGFEEEQLTLEGTVVTSLEDLERKVLRLDALPLIQLRVVMCLLEVVEHFMQQNEERVMKNTGIWKQASIYRQEEYLIFSATLQALTHLRDTLSNHPTVLSYLENN